MKFELLPGSTSGKRPCNAFTALTYNVLAHSLGSNTIPWVLSVSRQTEIRVEKATCEDWADWRRSTVEPAYVSNWHKNLASGDYSALRRLWGAQRLVSEDDLSPTLRAQVRVVGEDEIAVGEQEPFFSLRGVLRNSLGSVLGLELFAEIVSNEENIYAWAQRGPRIFDAVTQCDLVALCEYDIHEQRAFYSDKQATFAQAMIDAGYDGIFAEDPFIGRKPASGLALYWRRDVFELAEGSSGVRQLECGSSTASAWNVDMRERLMKDGEEKLMREEDRRNAALVRLRHKATGEELFAASAHLMTSSRDNSKHTAFPGQVRANELATIRGVVSKHVPASTAVLFLGDFNTAPSEAHILRGELKEGASELNVETRFVDGELRWADSSGGALTLVEAFAEDHGWATDPADERLLRKCTSRNSDRLSWIDYVFYTPAQLRVLARSDTTAPENNIPDETHPSDHLPLAALFQFTQEAGKEPASSD